jgi:hypothetical protein
MPLRNCSCNAAVVRGWQACYEVHEKVGGFGHLLMLVYDWEPRRKLLIALELLAKEVMPKLAHLS